MIEEFIKDLVKLVSISPDEIRVEKNKIDETLYEISIFSNPDDIGKIIGKDGKMISSLKILANGCKAKDGISYKIVVKPN